MLFKVTIEIFTREFGVAWLSEQSVNLTSPLALRAGSRSIQYQTAVTFLSQLAVMLSEFLSVYVALAYRFLY